MAGYDMHIDAIKAGIGALFTADQIAAGLYGTYKASLMYSQQIKINRKMAIKIGIEGTYIHSEIKWNQLLWSDMINPLPVFIMMLMCLTQLPNLTPNLPKLIQAICRPGLCFFTENLYVGFAVNNMLMHHQNFTTNAAVLTPLDFVAHFGGQWNVKHRQVAMVQYMGIAKRFICESGQILPG